MSELSINRLNTADPDFEVALRRHTEWEEGVDTSVRQTVAEILKRVRQEGDAAVLEYTAKLDKLSVASVNELEVPRERIDAAMHAITDEQFQALETAADRIRRYHREQLPQDWSYEEADGTRLGQRVLPVDRAGLYVPGGKAAYPSSVLMNAIPAKVAGVEEIVMVVPAPGGELNDLVLAAARVAGIDRIYTLGGAQAVAALAYGTETVPAVDKIVGPGNIYVAEAKREVFVPPRSWWWPMAIRTRTGSPWTCSPRPSTTNRPRRSWSRRMRITSHGLRRVWRACCRRWSGRRSSASRWPIAAY